MPWLLNRLDVAVYTVPDFRSESWLDGNNWTDGEPKSRHPGGKQMRGRERGGDGEGEVDGFVKLSVTLNGSER